MVKSKLKETEMTAVEKLATQSPIGRILAGIVAAVALIAIGRQIGPYLPQFATWVDSVGLWGPLIFILGYVAATIAFVPGSVLSLAAGSVFGLERGVVYVFIAATLGASLAFLLSRYLARELIEKKLKEKPKFSAIDKAVGREGLKVVLLLRLSPLFPFNLTNYALGLTNVRFVDYFVASIGMLPGTLVYTYYGTVAADLSLLVGSDTSSRGPAYYAVLFLGLVATIGVTTLISRIAQRALREVTESV